MWPATGLREAFAEHEHLCVPDCIDGGARDARVPETYVSQVKAALGDEVIYYEPNAIAGGRQYVSWIHGDDFVRACDFIIAHDELSGAINLAAPGPLPHREFMRAMRDAWGVPIGLPATGWMASIGSWAMRTDPELVMKSRRVVPGRLAAAGFAFEHPSWAEAARSLARRDG